MRRTADEWSLVVGRVELAVCAEKQLGIELSDDALEATATIGDFEVLLASSLGSTPEEAEELGVRLREWLSDVGASPPFPAGRELTTIFGGRYLDCQWEPTDGCS